MTIQQQYQNVLKDVINTDLSQVMNNIFEEDTEMAFIMALTKYINHNWR